MKIISNILMVPLLIIVWFFSIVFVLFPSTTYTEFVDIYNLYEGSCWKYFMSEIWNPIWRK